MNAFATLAVGTVKTERLLLQERKANFSFRAPLPLSAVTDDV